MLKKITRTFKVCAIALTTIAAMIVEIIELIIEMHRQEEVLDHTIKKASDEGQERAQFFDLGDYDPQEDEGVDPSWSPRVGTKWARDGGGLLDITSYEAEVLHLEYTDARRGLITAVGFDNMMYLFMACRQIGIRTHEATPHEEGLTIEHHTYMQGYDSGGFMLDPQLVQ